MAYKLGGNLLHKQQLMSIVSTPPCFFSPLWVFLFCFVCFLGLNPQHMEVPRLGVEAELQLPAYTTVTATHDLSHICKLHHSSQQHWIPDPLSEARDRTWILKDTSRICFRCATMGTPSTLCSYPHTFLPRMPLLFPPSSLVQTLLRPKSILSHKDFFDYFNLYKYFPLAY